MNIKDISKLAGVSVCTASRVLSGRASQFRISEKTAARVLKVAAEAGYRPNYLAHSLNTGRTHNLGLIFANSIDLYLGGILEGVESRLRDTEYQTVVATCENDLDLQARALRTMIHRRLDGIILYPRDLPPEAGGHAATPGVEGAPMPLVVIGRKASFAADEVMFDDESAGCDVARGFLEAGCHTFAFITQPTHCSSSLGRERGFLDELARQRVPASRIQVIRNQDAPTETDLRKLAGADAILGVNSGLLLRHLELLEPRGLLEKKSFASIGPIEGLPLFNLPIRTLLPPTHDMGRAAADLLLWRMENPGAPLRTVLLPLHG